MMAKVVSMNFLGPPESIRVVVGTFVDACIKSTGTIKDALLLRPNTEVPWIDTKTFL